AIVNERGERWAFERDSEGQVVGETDFSGRTRRYVLDDCGRQAEIVEASGKRVKQKWTPGGRLAEIRYPDGSFDAFEYDDRGEVVKVSNENGDLERALDPAGRLVGEAWEGF